MGGGGSKPLGVEPADSPYKTVYDVPVQDIDGNAVNLSEYKGKLLLVVNIATGNKATKSQLKDLAELEQKFGPKGLVILLFPCNDFGKQPDDPAAVKAAVAEAGLNCRIMQFAHVAGPDIHPLYNFLRLHDPDFHCSYDSDLCKVLVNTQGSVFQRYSVRSMPYVLEPYVKRALNGAKTHQEVDPRPPEIKLGAK